MSQQPPNQLLTLPGLDGGNEPTDAGLTPLPWWRRRRVLFGITIALLALIILVVLLPLLNRRPLVTYQYQHVVQRDLLLTINATGPLQSSTYNLVFQGSGGKIDEIDVNQGQKVTKGQILAKLDKTSLEDAVNADKASLTSAQLSLNSALANAGAAQNNVNTTVGAAQTSVAVSQANQGATQGVSDANVSVAQTTLDNARSNLERVRAETNTQISQAEAQRQQDRQSCTSQSAATATATSSSTSTTTITNSSSSTSSTSLKTCYQLADDKYNSSVATARANLTTAENTVSSSQQSLTQAQANANSSNTTAQGEVTTNQSSVDTDKASTSVTSAESSVATAQGNLAVAVANLQTAQHNLDNATLRAPHDGIVTTINGTVGGTPGVPVNSSSSTSTSSTSTFIQIADTSALQVQANVNESDTSNLRVGQPALFTVNAYGNQQFKGAVSGISPNGVTTSNVVTYPVTIDIDPTSTKNANLFPNMTANVTITVVQHHNVLQVPVNAINFAREASTSNTANGTGPLVSRSKVNSAQQQARQLLAGLEDQNPTIVTQESLVPAYIIEQLDGQFTVKPVVLGLTDGTNYEVLAGLTINDTVIVGSSSSTRPGTLSPGGAGMALAVDLPMEARFLEEG